MLDAVAFWIQRAMSGQCGSSSGMDQRLAGHFGFEGWLWMGDAVGDSSAAGLRCVEQGALDADAMILALDVEGFWVGFGTVMRGGWLALDGRCWL
mmetsp:Transcript_4286/g.9716  ORF Transcript_4286/g.9716 Transcript_4286/m.9716 type:complete len:95 (-) Transcript_4286:169-453(-)